VRDKDSKRNMDRNKVKRRKDRKRKEIWSLLVSSHCPVFVCASMGFVVFTAVRELCCDLVAYEPGGGLRGACRNITVRAHCLHSQDKEPPLFYPENGSTMLPRNISNHTQNHAVS
jgi:hypothetical protein